jgi:hypothetical protein
MAWWLLLALVLWLLGQAVDQAASLTACAASSAFLVGIGEIGDWLCRRWTVRRGQAEAPAQGSRSQRMRG